LDVRAANPEAVEEILRRLSRIEGQVRGIRRMIEEGSDCESVLVQMAALKSAVSRAALKLLGCELGVRIAREIREGGTGEKAAEELLESFLRMS